MMTVIALIVSGVLIGAGITVVWRDVRKTRRMAFVAQRDAKPSADAEVEIRIAEQAATAARPTLAAALSAVVAASEKEPEAADDTIAQEAGSEEQPEGKQLPALELNWAALQPTIAAGVAKINTVLAPVRLCLGDGGEAAWSYKNRGYGSYRRLLLDDQSMGWVRIELGVDGRVHAGIRPHREEQAVIIGAASAPSAGLGAAEMSDLLSVCLKSAASYAAHMSVNGGPIEVKPPPGHYGPTDVDAVIAEALRATNGAFSQAGAILLPLAPTAWDTESDRHRMTLTIEVETTEVARMHIERLAHEIEVAVGVRDPQLVALGRRRRIPIPGLSTHALAELIAGCAWPSIARFREARRSA